MGKKVRVSLFGEQRRNVKIDADATEGAVVGLNLKWGDGTVVQDSEIRNSAGGGTSTVVAGSVWTGPVLWALIVGIPAIIKSLVALATNGWIRNDSGTLTALHWPYVKPRVDVAETFTLPAGEQLLVYESFSVAGSFTVDGQLVILGPDQDTGMVRDLVESALTVFIPPRRQLIVSEIFEIEGTLDNEGILVVMT